MQMIKGFLIAVTGLFIMITLVSLFIPSQVTVTRGVVVNAGAGKVFSVLHNFREWARWQPALKADPAGLRFSNDSAGINSFCEWETHGKKNHFAFTALGDNRLTATLSREGENEVVNTLRILPLGDSNSVQVEWKALTKLKWYPWEKFYGIFIEKMLGQGYEDALNGLKQYVEGLKPGN
jgi:hypothetical protein